MVPFSHRCAVLAALLLICGCYRPYSNPGWQGQPGYYPAQPGPYQTPGQLYVPPSNGTLVAPGTELAPYDPDAPPDDFNNSGDSSDGQFFPEDDPGVPLPGGTGSDRFDRDFGT